MVGKHEVFRRERDFNGERCGIAQSQKPLAHAATVRVMLARIAAGTGNMATTRHFLATKNFLASKIQLSTAKQRGKLRFRRLWRVVGTASAMGCHDRP
ncbi:MAG: hypothetical protein AAGD07_19460, partial [Planctomycetota bacterium]